MHTERVSTFELFFDLVFVFTITLLTSALHADSSAAGVASQVAGTCRPTSKTLRAFSSARTPSGPSEF